MHRVLTKPSVVEKVWNKINSVILTLCVICTFLLIPISLGFIVYHSLIQYNVEKVILFLIVLCVMIWANLKMRGGS